MRQPRPGLAARRRAAGFTQESLAERLSVDRSTVARWESGETEPQTWLRQKLTQALGISTGDVASLLADEPPASGNPELASTVDVVGATSAADRGQDDVESCRQSLHDTLTDRGMNQASLDDWELTVLRYGVAAKDRAPAMVLADLASDFNELRPALARCRSATSLRRLTRVAAHLSGLMCLTLIKLDERSAFRRWTRTARIAAVEADDPMTYSWVLAQEAYGHFYSHDHTEAVAVAEHAQAVAGTAQPGQRVGGVLAAALEARAHAACGRADDTHAAVRAAEIMLGNLDVEPTVPTAFGYNEAQFRFHESNALTHLRDTTAAWTAQDRALELVAPGDFMDRAFTQLDRAMCLASDDDAAGATTYARDSLLSLSSVQRQGIIAGRAGEVLRALPPAQWTLPPARELHELLMQPSAETEG